MAEQVHRLSPTGRSYAGLALAGACLLVASAPVIAPNLNARASRASVETASPVSTARTTLLASQRSLTSQPIGSLAGISSVAGGTGGAAPLAAATLPDSIPELVKHFQEGFAQWPAPDVLPGVMTALDDRLTALKTEFAIHPNALPNILQTLQERQQSLGQTFAELPQLLPDMLNAFVDGFQLRAPFGFSRPAPASATSPMFAAGPTGIPVFDDLLKDILDSLIPLQDIYTKAENMFNTQTGTFPAVVKWVQDGFPLGPDLHPGVQSLLEQALSIAPGSYQELMTSQQDGFDPNRYTVPQALALADKILALEPGSLQQMVEKVNQGFEAKPDLLPAILTLLNDGLAVQPDPPDRLAQILDEGFTLLPGGSEQLLEQLRSADFYEDLALRITLNTVLGTWYQGVATIFAGASVLVFGKQSIPSQFIGGFADRGVGGIFVALALLPSDAVSGKQSIPSEFMRSYLNAGYRGLIGHILVFVEDLYDAANEPPNGQAATGENANAVAQLAAGSAGAAADLTSATSTALPAADLAASTAESHHAQISTDQATGGEASDTLAASSTRTGAGTSAADDEATARLVEEATSAADDGHTTATLGDSAPKTSDGNKVDPITTTGTESATEDALGDAPPTPQTANSETTAVASVAADASGADAANSSE